MNIKIKHGNNIYQGKQILKANIIKECDLLSVSLIEGTCDVELYINTSDEITFDENEPFFIYKDDNVEHVLYFETCKRIGAKKLSLSMRDVIGRLGDFEFEGDVYFDKNAKELIEEIFAKTDVQVVIPNDIANMVVTGRVPYTTCRDALSHVLFALGYYAKPSVLKDSACIEIKQYYEVVRNVPQQIPSSRVLTGVINETAQKTTGIEIISHGYEDSEDTDQVGGVYLPNHTIGGESYTITQYVDFEPPIVAERLSTNGTNASKVKIIKATANYAELLLTSITSTNSKHVGLYCREYIHTEAIQGKYSNASNTGQIVAIESKTLVNDSNITDVIDRCYEYYTNPKELTAKVVIGKHVADDGTVTFDNDVQCGDMVTIPTDYQGTYTGRVIKEQYNLDGNIIIKEITVK